MSLRTELNTAIPAGGSAILSGSFLDEDGAAISSLTTCVLTLFDVTSRRILNGRQASNILSSVSGGALTLALSAADNVLTDGAARAERHTALITWTWDSGAKTGKHAVSLLIENLDYVA